MKVIYRFNEANRLNVFFARCSKVYADDIKAKKKKLDIDVKKNEVSIEYEAEKESWLEKQQNKVMIKMLAATGVYVRVEQ